METVLEKKKMINIAARENTTVLNPAQLHLLQMLSFTKTEESLRDLKKLLRTFYIQQVEKEANQLWVEGKINDNLLNEHLRTPYK